MSVLAVRWAAEQTAGGPMPKLVLFALAEHADSTGRCHPSLSTLAGETEVLPGVEDEHHGGVRGEQVRG